MSAYAIMDVQIHDIGEYMEYMGQVGPLLEAAGARYLVRGGPFTVLEGDYQPNRLVLVEFPSLEALETFHTSEEYEALRQLRNHCSSTRLIAVSGVS
jgi:uncharacterized protein (DUF1330 family)